MIMKSSVPVVALIALVVSRVQAFISVGGSGNTHVTITRSAVLAKIREVCEAVAESEGRDFTPTVSLCTSRGIKQHYHESCAILWKTYRQSHFLK